MGILSALSSPKAMQLGLAASGVEAARIDYDPGTDEMVFSIMVAGRIKHHRLPCKVTFTHDEIAAWLAGDNPLAADPPAAGRPQDPVVATTS